MSSVITLLGLLQHSSFKSSVECYNYINFSVFPEQFKREYQKKKNSLLTDNLLFSIMAHFNLIYYSFFFIFLEFMTTFFFSSWERKQKLPLPHPIVYVAFNLVQSLVETCLAFPILTIGFSYGTDM